MAFVLPIIRAYEQRQMSPLAALEKAQIPPSLVNNASECITALQMEALSDAAMRELDDEGLGWFERRLPWGSYGMLARASISAPNLGLALARWCRHQGLITDDIQLQVSEQAGTATLTQHESRALGPMREFCMVSVLRNIHGFASWLINEPISLLHASFPFATPAHANVYKVLFAPGSIGFDAPVASLQFEARWLQAPLARDETALNHMLQRALPIQVRPYRPSHNLVQRVRQALDAHAYCGHTAESLAELLHLAPRSLHRQLQQAGTSLQQLKDEVRRQKACALLLRTDMPLKRIAQACGFASEKSFGRAFAHWLGMPPQQFRAAPRP